MVSELLLSCLPYGLAVRIPGFHPGGPGSTPGMGTSNFLLLFFTELHVLIKPVSSSSVDNESATAIEDIEQLYTTQVPMKKPLTRQQFVEAQKFWNCHFFEDKKYKILYRLYYVCAKIREISCRINVFTRGCKET